MELDKNLISLQGVLYSFWKQDLLNKRDTLQEVLNGIKQVTENAPEDTKAKLTFLMVLCTRLSVSEKLKDDNFVGQYINTEPYFEKEYLIIYIYHLNLQWELFKVIENCPGALGLELLEEIIEKLRKPDFCQVEFGVEHFYQLWQSVFVKLCKISTKLHVENGSQKFLDCFQDIYNLIEKVIITSMKSNTEFDGVHLYNFFKTFLFCIMLQKKQNVTNDPIYELSIDFDLGDDRNCCNAMTACIDMVFRKICNILQNLTIDMWMYFSECYCITDTKNSVQLLIGELVFNILKEVEEGLYNVPSDIMGFLSSIAINKSELIAKAEIDEIFLNVRNGEKEWFKALVRHSAFATNESINCLIDHLELADSDDLSVILDSSYEYACNIKDDVTLDLMKKLFLAALKKTPDFKEWFVKIFEKYQPSFLMTSETNEELIETFNKISKGKNIPQQDLISLCVQSPLETIKKICHIAVYSPEQTNSVIEILKLLKNPCNMSLTEDFTLLNYVLLKSLLEDLTIKEKQSFIDMVVQLGKENILNSSFLNNLLKCLKEYLESEMLQKAVLCLEIVNIILHMKIVEFHKAAFLVFMSQVLGYFSWDLKSFSITKADGREQADFIVTSIISELQEEENSSGFQWARQEILKSWEVNQAYFCDLWFKFDYTWCGSGAFHSLILALSHSRHKADMLRNCLVNFDQPFEVRSSIILSLITLLPVITFQKWNSVFDQVIIVWKSINSVHKDIYHDVLDMFGSAMQILGMNFDEDEAIYPCYKYCLRNFAKLAKQCCPKMSEVSLVRTFEKIFLLLGEIENKDKRESCWEIFPSLLMELMERLRKKNAVEIHRGEIEKLLPFLDLKNVAEGLLMKLQ